jgi:succinylarginine dihydrolase
MWTANAATVSPGADSGDGRVHFTPANLCSHLHRALEPEATARALQAIFADERHFAHHPPLPSAPATGDEGAANHTRLCGSYGEAGLEIFVYGRGAPHEEAPAKFPARQARAAGEAIARLHGLDARRVLHLQQNPAVIDAGVFHNDVIAVGNREMMLFHEQAFADASMLRSWVCTHLGGERRPVFAEVGTAELTVDEAVASYLFNSQLVCPPDGSMHLAVAQECREHPRAWAVVQRLREDTANPISGVEVFDLRQSMNNGGGPACLRLRVVLDEAQRAAVHPAAWLAPARHAELKDWVQRHYRDRLLPADLADPLLLDESRSALDQLTQILQLGSLYDFQR